MLLSELLKKHQVTHLVLEDPVNIFYFSKIHFSSARLLLSQDSAELFVDFRYHEKALKEFKGEVIADKDIDAALKNALPQGAKVAFLPEKVSYERFQNWKECAHAEWIPIPRMVAPLRMIKTQDEIEKIQEACTIAQKGYQHLLKFLKEGVTELDLAKELEIFFLKEGADGIAFSPIIGFGENSAIPHHSPTTRKLKQGDLVQFDIGCKKNGYCSDLSRVVAFGKVDEQLAHIEAVVMSAKRSAEKVAFPGTPISEFDQAARSVIDKHGFLDKFLHSLGHGVGLDIHEAPLIKQAKEGDVLQEGMVITIEPGIYLAGIGGVRLEDTYLITRDGPRNLTQEPPTC